MSNSEGNYYEPTVILSFLVGTLAGATALLLLAPRARRESTDRIREFSHDLKELALATVNTAKDKVLSVASRGRDFLDDKRSVSESAVEAGKEAYTQGRTRAAHSD